MDLTTAITLAQKGKQEYEQGNYLAAADLFSQAAQVHLSMQDELNAAELKNNESVALLQGGRQRRRCELQRGRKISSKKQAI